MYILGKNMKIFLIWCQIPRRFVDSSNGEDKPQYFQTNPTEKYIEQFLEYVDRVKRIKTVTIQFIYFPVIIQF